MDSMTAGEVVAASLGAEDVFDSGVGGVVGTDELATVSSDRGVEGD
jgi:hypothetical protein